MSEHQIISYSKFLESFLPKNKSKIDPKIKGFVEGKIIEFKRELFNDICFNFSLTDNKIEQEEIEKIEKLFEEITNIYSIVASKNLS